MKGGDNDGWWRREVVTKGSGDGGKWWRWEVVTKGSGEEGKWWWRGVVRKGSGEEGKRWRWEVVRKGSGEEGKWWWRGVVTKWSGEEGKLEHETFCFSVWSGCSRRWKVPRPCGGRGWGRFCRELFLLCVLQRVVVPVCVVLCGSWSCVCRSHWNGCMNVAWVMFLGRKPEHETLCFSV